MKLFRAYASARPSALGPGVSDTPVFFEASSARSARDELLAKLSAVWGCPLEQLDGYNLDSEPELRELYAEKGEPHADAALLGSGFSGGRTTYLDPDQVLVYVGPQQHRRISDLLRGMRRRQARAERAPASARRA